MTRKAKSGKARRTTKPRKPSKPQDSSTELRPIAGQDDLETLPDEATEAQDTDYGVADDQAPEPSTVRHSPASANLSQSLPKTHLSYVTPKSKPDKTLRAKSKIAVILGLERTEPEKMARFLTALQMGATPNAAAGILGLSPNVMSRWLERGRLARRGPYKVFWSKVVTAVQEAAIVAGVRVREKDPMAWLTRGPGRLTGDDWTDQPRQVEVQLSGGVTTGGKIQVEHVDMLSALRELKQSGVSLDDLTKDQATLEVRPSKVQALPAPGQTGPNTIADLLANLPEAQAVVNSVTAPDDDADDFDDDDEDADSPDSQGTNYIGGGKYRSANPCLPLAMQERTGIGDKVQTHRKIPGHLSVADLLETEESTPESEANPSQLPPSLASVFGSAPSNPTQPTGQPSLSPRKKPSELLDRLARMK